MQAYAQGTGPGRLGRKIDVDGRRLSFLALRMGIQENPYARANFLLLSQKIYGENNPDILKEIEYIRERTLEEWRFEILKEYPTSVDWLTEFRQNNQGKGINIDGRGLTFLGTQFGIHGDPRAIRNLIMLTGMIYGEDDPFVRRERERLGMV